MAAPALPMGFLGAASGVPQLSAESLLDIANIPTGTTSATVAAGDDSRIVNAASTNSVGQQNDFISDRIAAVEQTGGMPQGLGSVLSLQLFSHIGVLDAHGNAITTDGTAIGTWKDTSANALTAVQATTAKQPKWIKNAYGARPAIRFTSAQYLSMIDNVVLRPDSGEFHVFAVVRNVAGQTAGLVVKGNASSTIYGWSLGTSYSNGAGTLTTAMRCASASGATLASQSIVQFSEAVSLLEMDLSGTAVTGLVNGSATGIVNGGNGPTGNTYTAPISNTDPLLIGAGTTTTGFAQADFFAIVILKGATTTQIAQVRAYLQALYPPAAPPAITYGGDSEIWTAGVEYPDARIPALVRCNSGKLLAFCEGRSSTSDTGQIVVASKSLAPGSSTWSANIVVAADGANTCGNPAPIVNRLTGRVHLIYSHNLGTDTQTAIEAGTSTGTRTALHTYSDDEGVTWSTPVDITALVKQSGWRWWASGPGGNEQLASGRLAVPFYYTDSRSSYTGGSAGIMICDDDITWSIGCLSPTEGMGETALAQLPDGTIIASHRNDETVDPFFLRFFSTIIDGGIGQPMTISAAVAATEIPSQSCAGDIFAVGGLLVHTLPDSIVGRVNLTAKVSTDGGESWPASTVINAIGAYSDNVLMPDGSCRILYEYQSTSLAFGTYTVAYPKWAV